MKLGPPRLAARSTISISLALALSALGCGGDSPHGSTTSDDGGAGADLASSPPATPDLAPAHDGFEEAARPPWPTLPEGDTALLSPLTLVTVVAANDASAADLLEFGQEMTASMWWKSVTADYGVLPAAKSVGVTGPAITADLKGAGVESYVQALVMSGAAPAPNGNTMYMVYLPDGVSLIDDDTNQVNTSCNLYEGYHQQYGSGTDNLGVAQRCFGPGPDGLDDITGTGSHEVLEAVTDPDGNGWTFPQPSGTPWQGDIWIDGSDGGEVADLCDGESWREGKYLYARIWSTTAAMSLGDPCRPALDEPYYGLSAPMGWYAAAAGTSVSIPVTGFSTAPVGDFYVDPFAIDSASDPNEFATSVSGARHATVMGQSYVVINNGETAQVVVSVPKSAQSGDYVTYLVSTTLVDPGLSPDQYHSWPVGVYVP